MEEQGCLAFWWCWSWYVLHPGLCNYFRNKWFVGFKMYLFHFILIGDDISRHCNSYVIVFWSCKKGGPILSLAVTNYLLIALPVPATGALGYFIYQILSNASSSVDTQGVLLMICHPLFARPLYIANRHHNKWCHLSSILSLCHTAIPVSHRWFRTRNAIVPVPPFRSAVIVQCVASS